MVQLFIRSKNQDVNENQKLEKIQEEIMSLKAESVVWIKGIVKERPKGDWNMVSMDLTKAFFRVSF